MEMSWSVRGCCGAWKPVHFHQLPGCLRVPGGRCSAGMKKEEELSRALPKSFGPFSFQQRSRSIPVRRRRVYSSVASEYDCIQQTHPSRLEAGALTGSKGCRWEPRRRRFTARGRRCEIAHGINLPARRSSCQKVDTISGSSPEVEIPRSSPVPSISS
eukprot:1625683-Rhodomonas_salina.4